MDWGALVVIGVAVWIVVAVVVSVLIGRAIRRRDGRSPHEQDDPDHRDHGENAP